MTKKNIMENSEKKNIMEFVKKLPQEIEYMIYEYTPRPTEHISEIKRARWNDEDKYTNEVWGSTDKEYEKYKYGSYIRGYIKRIKLLDGETCLLYTSPSPRD